MSYGVDRSTRRFHVDKTGLGQFVTIKAACDYVATLPVRDGSNKVEVSVGPGRYTEEVFSVPDYTTLVAAGNTGFGQVNAVDIFRTGIASDTSWITFGFAARSVGLKYNYTPPANFNAPASIFKLSGLNEFKGDDIVVGTYNGANPLVMYDGVGLSSGFACSWADSIFRLGGSGMVGFDMSPSGAWYYCQFLNQPSTLIRVRRNGGTDIISHCRLYEDSSLGVYPYNGATTAVLDVVSATGIVYVFNSQLDSRDIIGAGASRVHHLIGTPSQLGTALPARSRDTTFASSLADRTFDAYEDGTMECDTSGGTYSIFMPPVADAYIGQSFVVKILANATGVTVDGNGVNIDGAATHPLLGTPWAAIVVYKNSRSTWSVR